MSDDLRIPLSALPGFDPVGLVVYSNGERWLMYGHVRDPEIVALDLADASTRDRLARWCLTRRGLSNRSTAPYWGRALLYPTSTRWMLGSPAAYHATAPTLADLDGSDPRTLPDGSLYVDAIALRIEALYLGSQP